MIRGDCLDVMPKLQQWQLVVADLPFGVSKYNWDCPVDLAHFWRVARGTPCVAFANRKFLQSMIDTNIEAFRYELVWDQGRGSTPLSANNMPMRSHMYIAVFARGKLQYTSQKTAGHSKGRSTQGGRTMKFFGKTKIPGIIWESSERHPTSVLRFAPDKKTRNNKRGDRQYERTHPSAKPVALLQWLIKSYSHPGDTVLDPTAGSFSSCVASLSAGRSCVGIELDGAYFEAGVERVRKTMQDKGLDVSIEVRR